MIFTACVTKNPVCWTWFLQLDFSKIKYRSTGGKQEKSIHAHNFFSMLFRHNNFLNILLQIAFIMALVCLMIRRLGTYLWFHTRKTLVFKSWRSLWGHAWCHKSYSFPTSKNICMIKMERWTKGILLNTGELLPNSDKFIKIWKNVIIHIVKLWALTPLV